MNVRIYPSLAHGSVSAPPSKSMAHRALICAALSSGVSRICGVSDCEDVSATLDCLRALGAECKIENDTVTIHGMPSLAITVSKRPLTGRNRLKCSNISSLSKPSNTAAP